MDELCIDAREKNIGLVDIQQRQEKKKNDSISFADELTTNLRRRTVLHRHLEPVVHDRLNHKT